MIELDPTPRYPGMVLALDLQRRILGKMSPAFESFFSPEKTAPAMINACARVRLSASPRLTSN